MPTVRNVRFRGTLKAFGAELQPGESADVNATKDQLDNNAFVKAGWLEVTGNKSGKAQASGNKSGNNKPEVKANAEGEAGE